MNLDLNRGVTLRTHPSGLKVAMYKDEPGVYYDTRGGKVDEGLARAAGFDTERLGKEKRKQEKMRQAQQQIEREFAERQDDIEAVAEATGELTVKHVGGGGYAIIDEQGNRLTKKPMKKEAAEEMLAQMSKQPEGGQDGATA